MLKPNEYKKLIELLKKEIDSANYCLEYGLPVIQPNFDEKYKKLYLSKNKRKLKYARELLKLYKIDY